MVKVVRARDAEQLAQARQVSSAGRADLSQLLELQRMQMEQEQLKYLQTLRTGKPASPAAPGPKAEGAHLEAVKITQQMEELRAFQKAVIETADEIRPKSNPYEFLNSGFMTKFGEGLGTLVSELGREGLRVGRGRATDRGPIVGGTAPAMPAQTPPRLTEPPPPPQRTDSGFIGSAAEDVARRPMPQSNPASNPGAPTPSPVTLRLSEEDKEVFAKTQRMVQTMAEMQQQTNADVRALTEKIQKLEGGRDSENRRSSEGSPGSPPQAGSTPAAQPAPESDANAAMELASILADRGIESVMTPRFKIAGKPVVVKPTPPAAKIPAGVRVEKITKSRSKSKPKEETKHGKDRRRK